MKSVYSHQATSTTSLRASTTTIPSRHSVRSMMTSKGATTMLTPSEAALLSLFITYHPTPTPTAATIAPIAIFATGSRDMAGNPGSCTARDAPLLEPVAAEHAEANSLAD